MDDLDEIRAHNAVRGPVCAMCTFLRIGDPAVVDKVQRALDDPTIQRKAVWRWMDDKGLSVPMSSLERHAKGECVRG